MERLTYTVPEAAAQLQISVWTYYRRAKLGELPVRKIGRRSVVPVRLLEEWVNSVDAAPGEGQR